MSYLFLREDNDEVIEVDFATMMTMDSLGCITLKDGATARRVRTLEPSEAPRQGIAVDAERPIVSDALGITHQQLESYRADLTRHGFSGVEFKPDPHCPGFYQAHFSGRQEWQRYIKHRGLHDRNSAHGSGASLSQADLDRAAQLVRRDLAERAVNGDSCQIS